MKRTRLSSARLGLVAAAAAAVVVVVVVVVVACCHVLDHRVQIPDKGLIKVGLVLLERARERAGVGAGLANVHKELGQRALAHADVVVELLRDLADEPQAAQRRGHLESKNTTLGRRRRGHTPTSF